jgi:diacylglycerol kinase family enzyme
VLRGPRRPLDGEVRGTTPVRASLLPSALRVLVPPTFPDA